MNGGHEWADKIPKVLLTWLFAWLIAFAVVGRFMWTGDAPPTAVLTFSSALIFAAAGLQWGMYAATKPEVIRAETEAKESAAKIEALDPNEGEGRTTAEVDPQRGMDDEGHPL